MGRTELGNDVNTGGVDLSGGQWQKLAIARGFIQEAKIVVFDEPTSAVDPEKEYHMFRRYRELLRGKTSIIISHRFSTVRMAERIIVIEGGKVIEDGSHLELMESDGRYAELFNMQAEGYR